MANDLLPPDYPDFLSKLKERIRGAQVRAALAVNRELVLLYRQIWRDILARQQNAGWGGKVIDRLARDLKSAFPEMQGLSRTNLLYMRAFAEAWPDETIVQQVVGQIPWGHNVRLLDKLSDREARLWYAEKTIAQGWSRAILEHHENDAPTIGIILCKTKNETIAEYALRDMSKPIGVAAHLTAELTRSLPADLQSDLPTIAELEAQATAVPFPANLP